MDGKVKVVTFINADCSSCIEDLKEWTLFVNKADMNKVRFIFLIRSNYGNTTFENLNTNKIDFDLPYFYDNNDSLFTLNKISEDKLFQTFLLDEQNKVKLIGNPIGHKRLSDLYLKEIQQTIKDSIE